ncbi:MAG: hypothetical protein A2Z08_11965 [Deltaproteobacteria bacterium RBG_16_54_11]|nr:MAG: hypothetical protein A2Z08_11965 [Deltaproteobacteria bacterium RBG_16_54_11]
MPSIRLFFKEKSFKKQRVIYLLVLARGKVPFNVTNLTFFVTNLYGVREVMRFDFSTSLV